MLTRLIAMVFACVAANSQTGMPAFEAASIKTAIPLGPLGRRFERSGGPGTQDPGLYRCRNCSLYQIVLEAYDIRVPLKFAGPEWLESVRFDVSAKVPDGATREAFRAMLRNLLAERFKLAVHREQREMPLYELVVAKNGPKFQQDAAQEGYPLLAPGMAINGAGRARLRAENQTVDWLADMLTNQMRSPVIDATGLKGRYDFALYWVVPSDANGPSLSDALQSQLGLKLQGKKGPIEVLVADRIERTPTEN